MWRKAAALAGLAFGAWAAYIATMPLDDANLLDAGDADFALNAARSAVALPAGARVVAAMSGGVDSTVTAALC